MLHVSLEDVMSSVVVTVTEKATVGDAAHLLLRHRINGLLVVRGNNKKRVVGVVTTTDLLKLLDKALSRPRQRLLELDKLSRLSISEVSAKNIVGVQKNVKITKVIALMNKKRVYTLPVYDGKRLVGVIGRHDILNVAFGS